MRRPLLVRDVMRPPLTEADLLKTREAGRPGTLACHAMSRPALTVGPDVSIGEAAHLMLRYDLGRLPVVDADGRRRKEMMDDMKQSAGDVEILPVDECRQLLRSRSVGRIALNDHGQPLIFPVNYAADDRAIVFRTAPGMKLDEAPMTRVAFEVDDVDTASGVAWSVMVQGVAYEITQAVDRLSEELRQVVVTPMAPGEREHWVAVMVHQVSGRRFRLAL